MEKRITENIQEEDGKSSVRENGYLPGLLSVLDPMAAEARPARPEGPGNPPNPVRKHGLTLVERFSQFTCKIITKHSFP